MGSGGGVSFGATKKGTKAVFRAGAALKRTVKAGAARRAKGAAKRRAAKGRRK